jgi:hypothetical protein
LIAELRAVIADLRADGDAWREQAQRLVLPAPKSVEQPPVTSIEHVENGRVRV